MTASQEYKVAIEKKKPAYNSFLEEFIYYKLTSSKISTNSIDLDIFL